MLRRKHNTGTPGSAQTPPGRVIEVDFSGVPSVLSARRFLNLLAPREDKFTFQALDDLKRDGVIDREPRHGTLDEHVPWLVDQNRQGAGIFVTVNQTDLCGRKDRNIVAARAVYLDLDNKPGQAPLQQVLDWLPPDILVSTSPDHWQLYWRVSGCPLDEYSETVKKMVARFRSDNIHDLSRVLRLPGFFYKKATPYRVRIDPRSAGGSRSFDELVDRIDKQPGVEEWLAKVGAGEEVHNHALRVTFAMVRDGASDEDIRQAFERVIPRLEAARGAGRVVELRRELAEMIASARKKRKAQASPKPKNAFDLMRRDLPPLPWVVPGLLPAGLTVLAASPKVGKSWLALAISLAVATGGTVFDREVAQGDVLHLALEDGDRRLQSRLRKLGARLNDPALSRFEYQTQWAAGQQGADDIKKWIDSHPNARLVVIDVYANLRGPTGVGKEVLYNADYNSITQWKPPADSKVAVILVHHTRKAKSEDPLELTSGTSGITGGADSVWILMRPRHQPEGILHIIGRDLEEEGEYAVEFNADAATWRLVGDAWEVQLSKQQKEIIALVSEQSMKPSEISDATGRSRSAIRKSLSHMVRQGKIVRDSEDRYRPIESKRG